LNKRQAETALSSRSDAAREEGREGDFFSIYASLPALSRQASRSGEAIELFHTSSRKLESIVRSASRRVRNPPSSAASLPEYCALLSLIYWLYPNYIGYNRIKNALSMLKYARAASAGRSLTPQSEAYVVGLFVQIRILPFLIRSRKASMEEITLSRDEALKFVSEAQKTKGVDTHGFSGLIFDALGFSYYQLERDKKTALSYLSKATEDLTLAEKHATSEEKGSTKQGQRIRAKISFYNALLAVAYCDLGICYESEAENKEGQEMLSYVRVTRSHYQKAYEFAKLTPWHFYKGLSAYNLSGTYMKEGEVQIEKSKAAELLRKAVSLGEESLRWFSLWSKYESDFVGGSWIATFYQKLARDSDPSEERALMSRSVKLAERAEDVISRVKSLRWNLVNIGDIYFRNAEYYTAIASRHRRSSRPSPSQEGNGETQPSSSNRSPGTLDVLRKGLSNCLKSKTFYKEERHSNRAVEASLLGGDICYQLLSEGRESNSLPDEDTRRYVSLARRLCNSAMRTSQRFGWNERVAEANWHLAQVCDLQGMFRQAAEYYEKSNQSYLLAMSTAPAARLYQELAFYMLAWNRIERAKLAHRVSEFLLASDLYREAATLVQKSRRWQHTSQLYLAESLIEKAEGEAFIEKAHDSVASFGEASKALTKFREELGGESPEEDQRLEKLAGELLTFCQARTLLENSKESFRVGDIEKSIDGLAQAERIFTRLSAGAISDVSRADELSSLASLCAALQNFQKAQLNGDSILFVKAKEIFARAASRSRSKSLKPLLLGLSSFADFLYSSKKLEEALQSSFDVQLIVQCNEALDNAEVMFRKLGNKSFLNMLMASKHVLDATIKISAAEREIENAEVRAKLYSQAKKSLSLASKYYQLLGSSKRVKESLRLISDVSNHERLIPLAHNIITEVASSQLIYAAISTSSVFEQTPESSSSVLSSAFVSLDLEIPQPYVTIDQDFTFSITLSNLGRDVAITVRIDEAIPEGFEITSCQYPVSGDRSLAINTRIEPGGSKQAIITARARSAGEYVWHPSLVYLDSSRQYKVTKAQTGKIVVEDSVDGSDFAKIVAEKVSLEAQLRWLQESSNKGDADETLAFSLKEKISNIEEKIMRTRNEFESLTQELEMVKSDIAAIDRSEEAALSKSSNRSQLETEAKVLQERIERRRRILEQAHLLPQ